MGEHCLPRLEGERLILTDWKLTDVDDITALLQAPEYSHYTTVPSPYTRAHAESFIHTAHMRSRSGAAYWAIRTKEDGRLVGSMSLEAPSLRGSSEIGYWMAQDCWNEGLTTEAVRLAVDWGLDERGIERIEWRAREGHWASWKPVWRCGFTREGLVRTPEGRYWSAALLKGDERAANTPWEGPENGRPALEDPRDPVALVTQFHSTYFMPNRLADGGEATLDYERLGMRMSLIREEFAELMGAVYGTRARALVEAATEEAVVADDQTRDIVDTADALADLVYVIYGMALESGIDLTKVLAEVQASNLSKLMPDGSVKLREDGKVLKGPNFFPPNVRRALGL